MDAGSAQGCGRDAGTWPVCSKPRGHSAQGICDLAGNVWEWTQDRYHDSYAEAPTDGLAWEQPGGSVRVIRDGGWGSDARGVRAAARFRVDPGYRNADLGFRPARSVP